MAHSFKFDQNIIIVKGRIYHGRKAAEGERPFQLFVITNPEPGNNQPPDGGAVLIKPNWALTAAHVVLMEETRNLYNRIKIGAGSTYWDPERDPNLQTVEFNTKNHVFPHKDWDWDRGRWDGYGELFLLK